MRATIALTVLFCFDCVKAQQTKTQSATNRTPAELLQFMEDSLTLKPTADTAEAVQKAFSEAVRNIVAAADKVLGHKDATPEQKKSAMQFKIDLVFQAARSDLPGYHQKLKDLAKHVAKSNPGGDMAALGAYRVIMASHETDMGLKPSALPEIEKFIKDFPGDVGAAQLLEQVVDAAEWEASPASGKRAASLLKQHFPETARQLQIDGVIRRLNLIGNPIELAGSTVDGKPFDVASLNGKVVLVDFWATWCGPCLAELPHLRETYEKYHDKGFEIVGVPLDEERDVLVEFLSENELPWIQIFASEPSKRGFNSANASRYGIGAIPAMFLVDQKGRVVSTTVRGAYLEALVSGLLERSVKPARAIE